MVISSALPAINPLVVSSDSERGPTLRGAGQQSRNPGEAHNPATPPAPAEATETRGDRGERAVARDEKGPAAGAEQGLDEAQIKELQQLKARDREVRTHELAHQAVGGQYAGAASYTFQRGPDGNQYAVGGEVSIDLAPVEGDPEATIEKMRTVRAAAMAPAEPSGQDRAVAAQAMQQMLQAQLALAKEERAPDATGQDREPGRSGSISASNTYQAVSGMVEPATERPPFEAVA